ncbi:MAG: 16S rRNA (guanine(966)-N(2))-methyltransferase RsmD [Candidatus Omnitrophota bacterium]|nr:16S rRNA (guanine(966)-N(2))-methyltransferase RsmD [Candidatus Omnitrophota bacterium]
MRITSGAFKSRIIKAPGGIRPTLDNVRKSVFDILGEKVIGARVLDLYAGSGAFGLEALSRGAGSCVFVDNSRASVAAIRDNLQALKLSETGEIAIIYADSLTVMAKFAHTAGFDLIFLDPPYYKSIAKKSLSLLGECDILTKTGIVIVEHSKHDELPAKAGELTLFRNARYGDTEISFYRKE